MKFQAWHVEELIEMVIYDIVECRWDHHHLFDEVALMKVLQWWLMIEVGKRMIDASLF